MATGNTNSITQLLLSDSSLHTCLITEGTTTIDRRLDGRKLRSMSSPISGDDGMFNRGFSDEYVNEPTSPFALVPNNAFVDESGTVIKPKIGFTRSTRAPGFIEHVPYLRDTQRTQYEEAALYVQEGIDNDKFASHPNGVYSKMAFNIAHNPLFYITEFLICCLLLALATIEHPAWITIPATDERISVVIHTLLEMLFLSIIAFNILLRFIWMKPKTFLKQRTSITAVIMVVMFLEAMVVLVKQDSHIRVTRCLRPIFFIDSYIMSGVRRVLRQIIQCIKPIADVMILLFFMVAIFALAVLLFKQSDSNNYGLYFIPMITGYYLFADVNPTFFDSYLKSFVSLFVTLTTANHPDVFMEAYVRNSAAPLFFILYLFVTLYFFSNVLLAVVYAHFSEVDKDKFRKLYLHKREALRLTYFVLSKNDEGINFHDFLLFMLIYKPRIPEYQVMCIFKALQFDPDPQESLCLEEFYRFYEMQNLEWKKIKEDGKTYLWFENFNEKIQPFFKLLDRIVKNRYFNSVIALIIMCNALFLILYTLISSFKCAGNGSNSVSKLITNMPPCGKHRFEDPSQIIIVSFLFTTIYVIELVMRILAVGPVEYFRKWWNRIDFIIIAASFIFLFIELSSSKSIDDPRSFFIVVRPIKLFRLLRLKKRYYEIMNTVFFLGYRLLSVLLLLMVVFYFYAIIGMEIFQGTVYVGCCENALYNVGAYYQGSANISTFNSEVYWLNNFDNIYQSYVILYEEMVVNNWFVQMEGFVSETGIYTRFYFISFWITTTVCLSVIIAYIVDAFVFRIHVLNRRKKCDLHPDITTCACDPERKKKIVIRLATQELNTLKYEITLLEEERRHNKCVSMSFLIRSLRRTSLELKHNNSCLNYIGKRLRTREDLNLEMHKDELSAWEEERDLKLKRIQSNPQKKKSISGILWDQFKKFILFFLE